MQQQIPNNTGVVKDEISLKELILSVQEWWKYIRGKWKMILIAGVVGGALGLVYSLVTKPTYKAEASFVLESAKSEGGVMSIAAKFGLGGSSSGEGLFGDEDNMVVFLKSRTMGARTLLTNTDFNGQNELLINRYITSYKLRDKWKSERLKNVKFNAYPQSNTLLADSMVSAIHKLILKKNLEVAKPDKDGNIINVTTISIDELFSKAFTEHLIENATEFYTTTTTKKAADNVAILQKQADSVRSLLDYAISGVAVNTDAVPNLNPAFQRLKVGAQKEVVDVEMNKAILEEIIKNLELAKIDLRRQSPLVQIIDNPVLPLEKKKIGKMVSISLGGIFGMISIILISTIRHYFVKLLNSKTD